MKNKTFKYDLIVLVIILMIIGGLFLLRKQENGHLVRITVQKKEYGIYSLNKNQKININNKNILIIQDNEIYMEKASCPDKTCIKQGHISQAGSSIICLPHQVIVEVIDGEDGDQDEKVY